MSALPPERLSRSEKRSDEIFRHEGANFRSIRVTLDGDGTLMLDAQDMGELVREVWGDSDYEFWCRIPPEAVGRLAYALLKKHYAGNASAVDDLRERCLAENIPHENGSWA